jgi:hypothetical protein
MPYLIKRNPDYTFRVTNKDTGKIYAYATTDAKKLIRTIESKKVKGGIMPISSKLAVKMEHNAYDKSPASVEDWTLLKPYTIGVKPFMKGNIIILAIRGTKDTRDITADIRIANGSLNQSARYFEDKNFIINLQKQYPQNEYEYYGIGHSLGGAIIDLLLNDGLIKEAITYNPAVEYKFYKNTKNYRIYNESDPLYNLMGRFTTNHEVRKNKLNLINKVINLTKIGKLKNSLLAHKLSNFDGGIMFY